MSDTIKQWISPHHLTEDAIAAMRRRFDSDPTHTIWFDDFLLTPRLDLLRRLFSADGQFRLTRCIVDPDAKEKLRFVDAADYEATPADRHFEYETSLIGPAPGREAGLGYREHQAFVALCRGAEWRSFFQRVTGVDPVGVQAYQVRNLAGRHFVARHTDNGRQRRLCMVLYLSRDWNEADSGQFRQFLPDGETRLLEPRPNRLVLFQVSRQSWHDVLPLAPQAGPRWSYTVWMGGEPGVAATPQSYDPPSLHYLG